MARSVWLGVWVLGVVLVALTGCRSSERKNEPRSVARFFIEARSEEASQQVELPQSGVSIAVTNKPIIAEFDVASVSVAKVDLGLCLWFQLTPAAARDLYRQTGQAQGRRLVLVIDGRAVGARRIQGPLANGVIAMFVEVADDQLPTIAAALNNTSAALQREASRM